MELDPSCEIKEECGIFGIFAKEGTEAAPSIYYGLCALQHRGQESCGIAVSDTTGPKGNMSSHKDLGLVNEVFKEETLATVYKGNIIKNLIMDCQSYTKYRPNETTGGIFVSWRRKEELPTGACHSLHGNLGIGHVRYSTTGGNSASNAQPLVLNYVKGTLALAHNGNLVNTEELRREFEENGAIFHTTTDSEVIAYCVARERVHSTSVEEAIKKTAAKIRGAYGLVIASPRKLVGVRDPLGLKPLCIGKREDAYVIASESCALSAVDAEFIRDVLPGEIVTITSEGIKSDTSLCQEKHAHCIFEYIYFARLDSHLDGISTYEARIRGGAALAAAYPVEADVIGVPDSGLAAAKGYSEASGIPFALAFHKNSYVGRTFIKPTRKSGNPPSG